MQTPPTIADVELEAQLLAMVLADDGAARDLAGAIGADAFTVPQHRTIWHAVTDATSAGEYGLIAIAGRCPEVPRSTLAGMASSCPTTALADQTAEALLALQRRREVAAAADALRLAAVDRTTDLEDAVGATLAALGSTAQSRADAVPIGEATADALEHLQRLAAGEEVDRIRTGLYVLDRNVVMVAGQVVVIGARPSVGKSALAMTIALAVARAGHGTLFVSCEMTRRELTLRAIAALSGVSEGDFRHYAISAESWASVQRAVGDLQALPATILDRGRVTLNQVEREARAAARRHGLRMIVVDYLQLLKPAGSNRTTTRENEVAALSAGLKDIAVRHGVTLIACAQLNREAEGSDRPGLHHLRDSGAIEQDADVVALLHRQRDSADAELVIAKNRGGEAGLLIPLHFDAKRTTFEDRMPRADQ